MKTVISIRWNFNSWQLYIYWTYFLQKSPNSITDTMLWRFSEYVETQIGINIGLLTF